MLEPKQGSPLHHCSRTFRGMRFVLLGFDPNKRFQVLSKLVEGGGVDSGGDYPNCTHVIVEKMLYDEPPCVAARTDGKILVSSLWVQDSLNVGMPVDHTNIMYRPLKDFKGIHGARSLFICLTGYQRQDREDIMILVGLMGATFSKPLVAAKVTHLICYKFEGEKYELAKRMGSIKIVNHRWLEDSLTAWELLPEANYDKCTYELELAEAEAKDSEDETEDIAINKSGDEITNPVRENQTIRVEASRDILDSNTSKGLNVDNTMEVSSTTVKQTAGVQLPNIYGHLNQYQDVTDCEKTKQCDRIESASGAAKELVSSPCTSSKKSPSGLLSYMRKSLNRTSPILSREMSDNLHSCSPLNNVIECNLSDGLRTKQANPGSSVSGLITSVDKTSPILSREISDNLHSSSPLKNVIECNLTDGLRTKQANPGSSVSGLKTSVDRTSPILSREISDNLHCSSPLKNVIECNLSHSLRTKQANPGSSVSGLKTSVNRTSPILSREISDNLNSSSPLKNVIECNLSDGLMTKQANSGSSVSGLKTSVNSTFPILSREISDNLHSSSPLENVNECNVSDGLRAKQANPESSVRLEKPSLKGADALPEEGHSGKLPEKRKSDVPSFSLKLQNTKGQTSEAMTPKVSTVERRRSQVFQPSSEIDAHVRLSNIVTPNSGTSYMNETSAFVSTPTSRTTLSPRAVPSFEEVEKEFEKSFLASDSKSDKPDACLSNSKVGIDDAENKVSSSISLKSDREKSSNSPTVDLVNSGSSDKSSKPLRTKMVAKKFFGSKKRSGKGSSSSGQKGSIYLNKDILHDNTTARSETTEYHSADSDLRTETKDAHHSANEADNKSEFIDDEAQPPEEDHVENEAPIVEDKHAQTEAAEDVQHVANRKDEHLMEIDDDIYVSEQRNAAGCEKSGVEKDKGTKDAQESRNEAEFMDDDETEALEEDKVEDEPAAEVFGWKHAQIEPEDPSEDMQPRVTDDKDEHQMEVDDNMDSSEQKTTVTGENSEVGKAGQVDNASKGTKRFPGITKKRIDPSVTKKVNSNKKLKKNQQKENESNTADLTVKRRGRKSANAKQKTSELGKENMPVDSRGSEQEETNGVELKTNEVELKRAIKKDSDSDPVWFILTGHKLQKKEYQQVIARLKGRVCRVSHQWSYKATHFIVPDPIRRTEKFFAAAASGRWILKTDYLSDSYKEGKFLEEEAYEWHKNSLNEDGAINLEAPRKWRLLRERTGHGAFHGMNIIIYGDCIAPSLDTLKRVIKAGGGTILATSPPYSRFLESKVDFAIVSPGMPHVDMWVQEFIRHEIPCVLADYLVEYVCKPGYSLERYVQYNTQAWAEKSLKNLINRVEDKENDDGTVRILEHEDVACRVCGSRERGEVMLICGDESGSKGCGAGTHIDCCDPPLESVPDQDWFCPNCTTTTATAATVSKSIKNLSKKPKKATPVSRRRK